jgi:C-terminal processing protease CtpA/Prc
MGQKPLFTLLCVALLANCGGGGDNSQVPIESGFQTCSVPDQNAVFFEFMQNTYLWYDQLPASINPQSYATVDAMLDDVRFSQDRFSGFQDREEYENFFENASFTGYGFSSDQSTDLNAYIVRYVFKNSAAEQAGLSRGDRLTNINGFSVTQINQDLLSNETVFGPDQVGFTIPITYQKPSGEIVNTQMSKIAVSTNTVFATQVFSSNVGEVGYLSFQNGFIEPSDAELETAFTQLASAQVDELILDLRYNPGGRLSVATNLASFIVSNSALDNIFTTLAYNDKNTSRNSSFRFTNKVNALDLSRVIVLSTPSTCSASELIINGLSPHMEVVTVGTATCGKPVGQNPDFYCDKVLSAINFRTVNSLDQGEYFDGLAPTCLVQDAIVADWGSLDDPIFAEAVSYVNTGSCSATTSNRSANSASKQQSKTTAPFNYQDLLNGHLH